MLLAVIVFAETPPRAWGRQPLEREGFAKLGNTPTGVGKTSFAKAFHGLLGSGLIKGKK